MKYHLPERIVRELCSFAQKYSITRIVLFGSRARGTNAERCESLPHRSHMTRSVGRQKPSSIQTAIYKPQFHEM